MIPALAPNRGAARLGMANGEMACLGWRFEVVHGGNVKIPGIQMTLVLSLLERTLFCRVQAAKWKTNNFHVYDILHKYWVHIQLTSVK